MNGACTTDRYFAREALLIRSVDELHEMSTISDSIWAELARHYATSQILEIIALTGYYHTISFMANAAGVDLESFAPRFPHEVAAHRDAG